jgi:hypothetical protein
MRPVPAGHKEAIKERTCLIWLFDEKSPAAQWITSQACLTFFRGEREPGDV